MQVAAEELGVSVNLDFGEDTGPLKGWRCDGPQIKPVAATPEQQDLPFEMLPLPAWIRQVPTQEPSPPRPLSPSRPSGDEQTVQSPRDKNSTRFRRGNVIHRLLQVLPEVPTDRHAGVASAFVAQPAYSFSAKQQRQIVDETLAVIADQDFADVFASGSLAEAPVAGVVGNTIVSGQVDRLVVTDNSVLIVDFKTNRNPPTTPTDIPSGYIHQMAMYSAVLSRVFPDHTIRGALLWTDGPHLMPIPDALLHPDTP